MSAGPSKGHRHTRSAAVPLTAASSQNPQNPHHLNLQAHAQNSQYNKSMDTDAPIVPAQPTTPPRTPKRNSRSTSQTTLNSTARENGSKQKSRNKNRPKNATTSPAMVRNDRNTPPFTGAQSMGISSSSNPINTPSSAAYAGPTFHASPAPSALPIPSFYSKSVPDSPGIKGIKLAKETALSGLVFTPPALSTAVNQSLREESPLDLFFNADREEKARARSATAPKAVPTGPFRPPINSPSISQTPPASSGHSRKGQSNRISPSSMFDMELDGEGDAGTPLGPAFSTPYTDRINAARSSTSSSRSLQQASPTRDNSQALKAYLFSDRPLPSPANTISPRTQKFSGPISPFSATPSSSQSADLPQRPPLRGYTYSQDSRSSNNITRQVVRSSYLRQEIASATPSPPALNHMNSNTNSSTPPRPLGQFSSHGESFNNKRIASASSEATPNNRLPPHDNRPTDVGGMEDRLRRMLNITGAPGIFAAAPVPEYGSGIGASTNGVH